MYQRRYVISMLSRIRSYKSVAPVLIAFFAISAIGVNVDLHFCGGHFAGISLMDSTGDNGNSSCCVKPCVEKGGDCCDDTSVSAALDYDGLSLVTLQKDHTDVLPIVEVFVVNQDYVKVQNDKIVLSDTGPPLSGQLLRIRYQSFLC